MNEFQELNKEQLKQNIRLDIELQDLKRERNLARREIFRLNSELEILTQINDQLKHSLFALQKASLAH